MRRVFFAVIVLLGVLSGCAKAETPVETEPSVQVTETPTQAPAETLPPVEEPEEGTVYLTVSKLVFSVVGEAEDIYCGTADREAITWTVADDTVAAVDNGVLTAVGVGSTTVTATLGEQSVSCQMECLAGDEEELMALPEDVLRSPKRYPPDTEYDPSPFFADAGILGDSITWMFYKHEQANPTIGKPQYLCRGGVGITGFVQYYKNLSYRGQEYNLEDLVALTGVKKLVILLGQNDLGFLTEEETLENYEILLNRIQEKSPGIELYLQTCLPEWVEFPAFNSKNEKIDNFNEMLADFAADRGYYLIDLAPYFEDHLNCMATVYSADRSIHMNTVGSAAWGQVLTNYVYLHQLEGQK